MHRVKVMPPGEWKGKISWHLATMHCEDGVGQSWRKYERNIHLWSRIIHCQKVDSLGYLLVADSMGLASTNLIYLAHKATEFGEIMQNNGHYTIQGHSFWYQWKACMRLPISQ